MPTWTPPVGHNRSDASPATPASGSGAPGRYARTGAEQGVNLPPGTEIANFHGADHFIRRSALERVGFFDPLCRFGGEEIDLSMRLRSIDYSTLNDPELVVYHDSYLRAGPEGRSRRPGLGQRLCSSICKEPDRQGRLRPADATYDRRPRPFGRRPHRSEPQRADPKIAVRCSAAPGDDPGLPRRPRVPPPAERIRPCLLPIAGAHAGIREYPLAPETAATGRRDGPPPCAASNLR